MQHRTQNTKKVQADCKLPTSGATKETLRGSSKRFESCPASCECGDNDEKVIANRIELENTEEGFHEGDTQLRGLNCISESGDRNEALNDFHSISNVWIIAGLENNEFKESSSLKENLQVKKFSYLEAAVDRHEIPLHTHEYVGRIMNQVNDRAYLLREGVTLTEDCKVNCMVFKPAIRTWHSSWNNPSHCGGYHNINACL